jgi:hypothetical protein
MNFISVIVGGISVTYALVELLPPDVPSPPDGSPTVPMLVSLFILACFWPLAVRGIDLLKAPMEQPAEAMDVLNLHSRGKDTGVFS